MKFKIVICIDDVMPGKGWRILGDETEMWLKSLNEEFGARFTLFIPSNYHNQFPLSKHKQWIGDLAEFPCFELAAHGHFHETSDSKRFGECEFFELISSNQCIDRLKLLIDEWAECDFDCSKMGWRNPGWLCSEQSKNYLENTFKYAAIHYEHNRNMKWNCKTFFGHDGINQENIHIHNIDEKIETGMVMFQSHIVGDWNDNVWNKKNYEQLRLSLSHIVENYDCEFKTLAECI